MLQLHAVCLSNNVQNTTHHAASRNLCISSLAPAQQRNTTNHPLTNRLCSFQANAILPHSGHQFLRILPPGGTHHGAQQFQGRFSNIIRAPQVSAQSVNSAQIRVCSLPPLQTRYHFAHRSLDTCAAVLSLDLNRRHLHVDRLCLFNPGIVP